MPGACGGGAGAGGRRVAQRAQAGAWGGFRMNDLFEVQWRLNADDKWEPQEGGFTSRRSANDFIASQPDGGIYRVVVEESGMTAGGYDGR